MSDKYINAKGLVGVIISPEFGAGFHSWNDIPGLCFDRDIIQMIIEDKPLQELVDFAENKYAYTGYICTLGLAQAEVHWVELGTQFFIDEYDGFESLTPIENNEDLLTA